MYFEMSTDTFLENGLDCKPFGCCIFIIYIVIADYQ